MKLGFNSMYEESRDFGKVHAALRYVTDIFIYTH